MKFNIINIRLVLYLSICMLVACEEKFAMDRGYSLVLTNNTSHGLHCHVALDDLEEGIPVYPDTSLPAEDISTAIAYGRTSSILDTKIKMKKILQNYLPVDTLSVFIFHPDTINKYSWEEIRDNYNILLRYDLSVEQLDRLDYRISYPPDSRMRGIKRFPK